MSNPTTKTADLEPTADDQSQYMVYSRQGIIAILNSLYKAGSLMTAHFDGGNFILTSVVEVRPEQDELVVDFGANAAANQHALQVGKAKFVTSLERIQIRFSVDDLGKTSFEGRDAFRMALPQGVLRLQRRESFRVAIPLARRLKCIINAETGPIEVSIIDISCGGVAIIDVNYPTNIESGAFFRGCRILLPGSTEVVTDILVRTTTEVLLKNGARQLRAGCEFMDMSAPDQTKIQRYVTKLERERMDRSGDR